MQVHDPSAGNYPEYISRNPPRLGVSGAMCGSDPAAWPDSERQQLEYLINACGIDASVSISDGMYVWRAWISLLAGDQTPNAAKRVISAVRHTDWLVEKLDWSWRAGLRVNAICLVKAVRNDG